MGILALVIAIVALLYVAMQLTFLLTTGLFMLFIMSVTGIIYAGAAFALGTVFLLNAVFPTMSGWWIALFALLVGVSVIAALTQTVIVEVKKRYKK